MKPYQTIPIAECGEALVPIPPNGGWRFVTPHPYAALGAPYGGASPWMLRTGVLAALRQAQTGLVSLRPGCSLLLFDAYRPVAVQEFMFQREFLAASGGRTAESLPTEESQRCEAKALRVWAMPSLSPATPPPHSTGAAIDITIAGPDGQEIWMGSPIDENSDRSNPDYFGGTDAVAQGNRDLLNNVMRGAGFRRHPAEWWHFGLGDQFWAWLTRQEEPGSQTMARYGRADLLPA